MKKLSEVTIYSKPNCPYCSAAKSLLDWNEIDYVEIDVSKLPKHSSKDSILFEDGNMPIIFIDDNHIGGYQHLVELIAQGKL
jgi:glutaredoxin 3